MSTTAYINGDIVEAIEDYGYGVRKVRVGDRGKVIDHEPNSLAYSGGQLLTVQFEGIDRPVDLFSSRVKLAAKTRGESLTVTEAHHLKPGDVVVKAPTDPFEVPVVEVRRQVPVAPPKPLPPTKVGSFVLANGVGERADKPVVPLFLTIRGWTNIWAHNVAVSGWDVSTLQERGFKVVYDAGADA